ncbi:MAG TPA: aspartyl protease family protein [Phenylobacterium sp.]|jgi:hypothetical protein
MRTLSLASVAIVAVAAHAQAATPSEVLTANQAATGRTPAGEVRLTYAYSGQGMTGVVRSAYDAASGAFADSSDVGPISEGAGFDGAHAWMRDASGAITPEDGGDRRQLGISQAYRNANLWWRADRGGAAIESLGERSAGGRAFDVLRVTPRGGKAFEAWFGRDDHLLDRTVEARAFMTYTTDYSDYRPVGGGKVAGKLVTDNGRGPETETLTAAAVAHAQPRAAYSAPKIALTGGAILNAEGRTTVPFQLLNNHIYAQVKVNGKGPFTFIFDTGGHSLLTPLAMQALGLGSEGHGTGGGAGDKTVDESFARHVTFQVGDLVLKDQTAFVVPFEAPHVEAFPQNGMLGFELFRRFVTVIDYGAKTLTFIDPAKFHPKDAGVAVPFVFYDHLPQVMGTFEGVPGLFDIDTGSRVEVTITTPMVAAHQLRQSHPKGAVAVDGWGVGGPTTSYLTRAREMTLGPVKIEGVVAGLGTQTKGSLSDPNFLGNVGSKLLKRFVVTLDYGHQVMYLKRLSGVTDTDTFDRSGAWINTSDKGFEIVNVTAGGAAADAGLKVGDQITAVDGAAAKGIGLSDLRERLRDPRVAAVRLQVESAGQTRAVDLKLKDVV